MKNPKVLSEKSVYKTSFGVDKYTEMKMARVRLPNGKITKWGYIKLRDAVAIVAVDKKKNVYLTKQWRLAWKRNILSLPAGAVKSNATEKERIQKVKQEMQEEIGFKAVKITKLVSSITHGSSIRSKFHIYLATISCN